MDSVDTFTVFAANGDRTSIVVKQVPDDNTWFEVYAAQQFIGKIHWRADTDAYMIMGSEGEMRGNFSVLSEAEDALIREAGYYVTIIAAQSDVSTEESASSVNDH